MAAHPAPGTPVYAAIEGINYEMIAPSLEVFFRVVAEMLRVTASLKARQPTSDDVEEWITFGVEVENPAMLQRFGDLLPVACGRALGHFLYS